MFQFLPQTERLASALTCRRWAETLCASPLLNDVWLTFRRGGISVAIPVMIETRRQYRNLRLHGGTEALAKTFPHDQDALDE